MHACMTKLKLQFAIFLFVVTWIPIKPWSWQVDVYNFVAYIATSKEWWLAGSDYTYNNDCKIFHITEICDKDHCMHSILVIISLGGDIRLASAVKKHICYLELIFHYWPKFENSNLTSRLSGMSKLFTAWHVLSWDGQLGMFCRGILWDKLYWTCV